MSNSISQSRINAALAVLRVALGIVFVAHGGQKLFVYGIDGVSGAFAQMGMPGFLGPVIGASELLGGIALIAGFLTPIASAGLSIIMLGAIFKVHLAGGFFMPQGYEFAFALLAGLVSLSLVGAGTYSVDGALARRKAQ
jgi:putative oxidoreductase